MQKPAPRVALIHATALAVAPVASAFERLWREALRMNLLDDSLSVDRAEPRELTPATPGRMPQYPSVPMVAESGLPGFEFNSWFAMMAPAGTPRPILQFLSTETDKALKDPEVREKLIALGLTPRGTTPDGLGTAMRAQLSRYGALIKQAGITGG